MLNKYSFKMTFLAESDIDSVLDYITNQLCNGQAAGDLYFGIEKAIEQIREYPFAQADCKRFLIEDENIRHIPVENYVLVYEIREKERQINILRFRYGRSNLDRLWLGNADRSGDDTDKQ